MATAGGQVTNAVFGFTSMLINLVKDHQPDSIVAAFDRPEKTFRHESVPTYKANRDEAPDILRQQMGLVREVVDALGVVAVDLAGYEADDIIATLAEQAKARGDDVVIVTGDRDTYQLVEDPHVKVLYNRRGVSDYAFYDEAGILERTGVTPDAVPAVRRAAGRPERQPAGRARRRREDGGQADHDLRRHRRDLRAPRCPDAQAAGLAGRARGAGPGERPGDAAPARRAGGGGPRRRRPGPQDGRGQAAVRVPRVPLAPGPAERGARRQGRGGGQLRRRGRRGRGRPPGEQRRGGARCSVGSRRWTWPRRGRARPGAAS